MRENAKIGTGGNRPAVHHDGRLVDTRCNAHRGGGDQHIRMGKGGVHMFTEPATETLRLHECCGWQHGPGHKPPACRGIILHGPPPQARKVQVAPLRRTDQEGGCPRTRDFRQFDHLVPAQMRHDGVNTCRQFRADIIRKPATKAGHAHITHIGFAHRRATGHDGVDGPQVLHRVRHGTNHIQTGHERIDTAQRHLPIGRLQPPYPAQRGRDADGPVGVRPQREWQQASRHRRRRPAR